MYAIANTATVACPVPSPITKAELDARYAAAQRGRIYVRSTRVA